MPDPIDFYFDFSSPYGYLAAQRIDEIGVRHRREVAWRPMLLGAVFKITYTRYMRWLGANRPDEALNGRA